MNLPLQLDRGNGTPLQDQLFEQLRQLIIAGKLKPNSRIIATRFLAEQAGISRTTVLLAYERLISEGYLETRPGIGTFVSSTLPDQPQGELSRVAFSEVPRQASIRPVLLRRDGHAAPRANVPTPASGFDFSPAGSDDTNLLPAKAWLKGVRNVFEREPRGMAAAQHSSGVLCLRQAIADHLTSTRGMMTSPEQVIVVTGRRQACSLVAHLLQPPGGLVVLESPGDEEVVAFFDMHRANVVRVAVDEHGLCTDQLPEENVSLVYVTPARHNPLGGILPLPRREALIKWARGAGAYIIEDDSDSEFRYHGTTPLPLAALDPYGLVFHTGSFGKTLGTGLDLGYLIVPSEFADAIVGLKSLADANCSWLEQMVVADLLISGEYHHHLRRVNKKYQERRDCLVGALSDYFGDVRLMGADAGTQLTWLLPEGLPAAEIVRETASAHGITLGSVSDQRLAAGLAARYCERALILGFASLACDGLRRGVACLAGALGGL